MYKVDDFDLHSTSLKGLWYSYHHTTTTSFDIHDWWSITSFHWFCRKELAEESTKSLRKVLCVGDRPPHCHLGRNTIRTTGMVVPPYYRTICMVWYGTTVPLTFSLHIIDDTPLKMRLQPFPLFLAIIATESFLLNRFTSQYGSRSSSLATMKENVGSCQKNRLFVSFSTRPSKTRPLGDSSFVYRRLHLSFPCTPRTYCKSFRRNEDRSILSVTTSIANSISALNSFKIFHNTGGHMY